MKKLKPLAVLILSFFLYTCGIEEFYYLPQVPEAYIRTEANTYAEITLPPLSDFRYAFNYSIFYRIYFSNTAISGTITTSTERSQINSTLNSDFNTLYSITDPTNLTSATTANTFTNRNYFELELDGVDIKELLAPSDKNETLIFTFPTMAGDFPFASFNNGPAFYLTRSRERNTAEPDPYFRNTLELFSSRNTVSNTNIDTITGSGSIHAYVSMYIVAVGMNPDSFTPIYSKPTHISIFKLPNM